MLLKHSPALFNKHRRLGNQTRLVNEIAVVPNTSRSDAIGGPEEARTITPDVPPRTTIT
jgi:hypothetical protein